MKRLLKALEWFSCLADGPWAPTMVVALITMVIVIDSCSSK